MNAGDLSATCFKVVKLIKLDFLEMDVVDEMNSKNLFLLRRKRRKELGLGK